MAFGIIIVFFRNIFFHFGVQKYRRKNNKKTQQTNYISLIHEY